MSNKMQFFTKFTFIAILIAGCSVRSSDSPPNESVTCIVTDKSKLEDIAIFTPAHLLNRNISQDPIDSRSNDIISLIGPASLKADFGSGLWEGAPIGIPFILVCNSQAAIPLIFRGNNYDANYGDESDPGPYPIPLSAPIEGNGSGDSHVLAVDIDNKILYELYNASVGNGAWEASCGVTWNLSFNNTRPQGWTSADAAGLPILPVLVRYDEILKGTIDHAIRFTLGKTKVSSGYISPANHLVNGTNNNLTAPTPMGMRLRLKPGFNISGYSETNQVILNAMKNYGIILTDIGSDIFISGAPDERWDNDDLNELKNVKATDFEVVQMGEIIKN